MERSGSEAISSSLFSACTTRPTSRSSSPSDSFRAKSKINGDNPNKKWFVQFDAFNRSRSWVIRIWRFCPIFGGPVRHCGGLQCSTLWFIVFHRCFLLRTGQTLSTAHRLQKCHWDNQQLLRSLSWSLLGFCLQQWVACCFRAVPFADAFLVILVQLSIAVIKENFDVAEELKKGKQTTNYLAMQHPPAVQASSRLLRGCVVWTAIGGSRTFKANPNLKSIAVENLPSNLILPMQKSIIQGQGFMADSSTGQVLG